MPSESETTLGESLNIAICAFAALIAVKITPKFILKSSWGQARLAGIKKWNNQYVEKLP